MTVRAVPSDPCRPLGRTVPHAAATVVETAICGWGGGRRTAVRIARSASVAQLQEVLGSSSARGHGAIARGMGRSYGDAARLTRGLVLDATALRGVALDPVLGTVRAGGGVTLGELLRRLAPAGWVLPVVPGTQHVTIGGAIAADIHGKNHRSVATFGAHVIALSLLTAAGELLELSAENDPQGFHATIGGMGLTGVIVSAAIRLAPLASAWLMVDADRVRSLDSALAILDGPGGEHRVAWLDLLDADDAVRGVVTRADQATAGDAPVGPPDEISVAARLRIPPRWPRHVLRTGVVRAHNELRFRLAPVHATDRLESFGGHMFPLDVLDAWPRLYGPGGVVQYQLVVPRGGERALEEVILKLRRSRVPCYLAVLKDFGPEGAAPLSFPLAGWTLALDLPGAAPELEALLSGLDELVADAGGRVYLAKDGRLRAPMLAAMYPRLDEWRAVRDRLDPERRWRSDLGLRTGLVSEAS
ncbi:MAG: FAD-binding protein [Solirubrobacteraceae bacterium]